MYIYIDRTQSVNCDTSYYIEFQRHLYRSVITAVSSSPLCYSSVIPPVILYFQVSPNLLHFDMKCILSTLIIHALYAIILMKFVYRFILWCYFICTSH
jgi:hypothetical protein